MGNLVQQLHREWHTHFWIRHAQGGWLCIKCGGRSYVNKRMRLPKNEGVYRVRSEP